MSNVVKTGENGTEIEAKPEGRVRGLDGRLEKGRYWTVGREA
jgi:hypothetical protein